MSISTVLTYNQTILADAPLGFWPLFDTTGTTATDLSGNGYDGSYVNSPTLSSSGVTLNGSNQYVTVPSTAFDIVGAAAQSYTFEIFTNVASPGLTAIMDKTNLATPDWNLLQSNSAVADFQLYDGSNNPQVTGGGLLGADRMLHAVRDVSLGQILLYRDAVLIGTASASSSIDTSNTTDLSFGSRANGTNRFFDGLLKRAAVYNYALSSTQIATHFAARAR